MRLSKLKESKTLSAKATQKLQESIWNTDPDTDRIKHLNKEQIERLYDQFMFDEGETITDAYFEGNQLCIVYEDEDGDANTYEPDLNDEEGQEKIDYIMNGSITEGGHGSGNRTTASQRYNNRMARIFNGKRAIDNSQAKFLKSKGLSDDEIKSLRDTDKLSKHIYDNGMNDEFWGEEEKKTPIQKLKDLYDADPYHSGLTQKELNQLRKAGLIEKSIKEDIDVVADEITRVIYDVVGHIYNDAFFELIKDIVERALDSIDEENVEDYLNDSDALYEVIWEAMDSGMVYTADQWTMLQEYCTPQEVDFDNAWSSMTSDVQRVVETILKRKTGRVEESAKLTESPVYGLNTQFDKRKSFYNKAHVDVANDGTQTLFSYNVPVCKIQNGEVTLLPDWKYSMTTVRHVKEFLKQNNFQAETTQQIARDYKVSEQ